MNQNNNSTAPGQSDLQEFEKLLAGKPVQLAAFRGFILRLKSAHAENDELLLLARFHIILWQQMSEIPSLIAEQHLKLMADHKAASQHYFSSVDARFKPVQDEIIASAIKIVNSAKATTMSADLLCEEIADFKRLILHACEMFAHQSNEKTIEELSKKIVEQAALQFASQQGSLVAEANSIARRVNEQQIRLQSSIDQFAAFKTDHTRSAIVRERFAFFLFGFMTSLSGVAVLVFVIL